MKAYFAKMRRMVIEDDASLSAGLVHAFETNFVVDQFSNGQDANLVLRQTDYDIVLLDLNLPGELDGLEILRRIRARGSAVPVLILSARDLLSDRVTGLRSGADDYITKPFQLAELEARVDALIRRQHYGMKPQISVGSLR